MRCSDPGKCVCGCLCAGVQLQRVVLVCHRPVTAGELPHALGLAGGRANSGARELKCPDTERKTLCMCEV